MSHGGATDGKSPYASMPGGAAPSAGVGAYGGAGPVDLAKAGGPFGGMQAGGNNAKGGASESPPPGGSAAKGGSGASMLQQPASAGAAGAKSLFDSAPTASTQQSSAPSSASAPATGGYVPGSGISDEELAAANANLPGGIMARTKADLEQQKYGKDISNAQAYAGSIAQGGQLPQNVQDSLARLKAAGIPYGG